MSFDKPGHRVTVTATRQHISGTPCVEGNLVGWAEKTAQLDRFVRPDSADVTKIVSGEEFVIVIGGEHECPLTGGLSAGALGDKLYITDSAGDPVSRDSGAGADEDVAAHLDTGVIANNNALTWTAEEPGVEGNSLSVTIVDPGGATASLSVDVDNGTDIIVSLARASSAITTTANDVKAAVEEHDVAGSLVDVVDRSTSNGTGVMAAVAKTNLAGGIDEGETGGDYPLGVIRQIDETRTPAVARVNTNAWQAFAAD
jgi:hypothetical protein